MTLNLRTALADTSAMAGVRSRMDEAGSPKGTNERVAVALIPGPALQANPRTLDRVKKLLGAVACKDAGTDLSSALEAGMPVTAQRRDRFLAGLCSARTIIVDDGLWLRPLRAWLPKARLLGLGEALNSLKAVRKGLRKTDLYVIEPRAYHRDYERLVKHYDRLRAERGCAFNLDLQRIAIPVTGQTDWILKGLRVERIVVESLEDAAAFERQGGRPVVHLAELANH